MKWTKRKKTSIVFSWIVAVFIFSAAAAVFSTSAYAETKLRVGVFENPPFAFKSSLGNWEGIAVDLWSAVAKGLDLNYEWVEVVREQSVEALIDKKIDVVAGGLPLTAEREKGIDFTQPFYACDLGMVVTRQPVKNLAAALFNTFFSWAFLSLVAGLVALVLAVGFLIWLIERKHNHDDFGENSHYGLLHGIFWSVAMMTQTGEKAPRSAHGKVIAILWILAGLFITSTFTASVTTLLTTESHVQKITSDRDLPQTRVGTVPGSYESYLRQMGCKVKIYTNPEEIYRKLLDGEIDAFVGSEPILRYYARKTYHSRLDVVPIHYKQVFFAFGLRTNDPLREPISVQILQIARTPAWQETLNRYLNY